MGQGPKPTKGKAKPAVSRKSQENERSKVRDLEKRLAAALKDKADALGQLQTSHRERAEAQEQQAATAEILRVISTSPTDLQPVFETIAENAVRLCDAAVSGVLRFDGSLIHLVAYRNFSAAARAIAPQDYPMAPTRRRMSGRAILDRTVVHAPDVFRDPDYPQEVARATGWRSFLSVPMLREAQAIGAVTVVRTRPGPFSDRQIELLKTFAGQAVIAIENVRLFTETKEALDRETATSEILRVIGSSPTDVQPVFEAIARSGVSVCAALGCVVFAVEGDRLRVAATHGVRPERLERFRQEYPAPLDAEIDTAQTIRDRRVSHLADIEHNPDASATDIQNARLAGYQTRLMVPMVRGDSALGLIAVTREAPTPFSHQQVALLQTFADQAIIAIENVRQFNETKEALEQQTATSEILRVISSSPTDVQPVFEAIAANAVRLCGAVNSAVFRFDGKLIHLATSHNIPGDILAPFQRLFPATLDSPTVTARAISSRVTVHVEDLSKEYENTPVVQAGYRTVLSVPMMREGVPIGAVNVARMEVQPFSPNQVALLQTFADQAVIAIENVRLFNELEARNRDLTESLEQQTATAEILRVISSSPTDIQPVLAAVAESAARLTAALDVAVFLHDGGILRLAAHHGPIPVRSTLSLIRGELTGRAVLEGRTVHVADLQSEAAEYPAGSENARRLGLRTVLSVPLLREGGIALGTINLRRAEMRLFTERQVALLQTFANQAVIAIENVRLFTELQASNHDLTTALDTQTATADILRVISRSQTDVQPVFDAVVESARRLLNGFSAIVTRLIGEELHLSALTRTTEAGDALVKSGFPIPLAHGSLPAQVVRGRAPSFVSDIETDERFDTDRRHVARVRGYRSIVHVPMLREGRAIGTIGVTRPKAGPFLPDEIALLQTFADQAVIAIENVRLFNETKEALERQTATSEILSVISRSTTDVRPVFEAICQSSVRLFDAYAGAIVRFDGQLMDLGAVVSPSAEADERYRRLFPRPLDPQLATGQAILGRTIVHIPEIEHEATSEQNRTLGRGFGYRRLLVVPMVRDGIAIGALAVTGREPGRYSDRQIALLQTFADQAVIAIENVRLFTELQEKNQALTQAHAQVSEALDQQTATSEILRVISRSQADARPVFESIAENALRLFRAWAVQVYRLQGQELHLEAARGGRPGLTLPEWAVEQEVSRASYRGRSILDRAIIHVRDVLSDPKATDRAREWARADGWRSVINAPMLRDGAPIGLITVYRLEPGGFLTTEVELLKTFADQAVIAIENARLLSELQARTQELMRSVGELRALGEVGRAVSSTLDLETVLTTIVSRAVQLADLEAGAIYEYDEAAEVFHLRATQNLSDEFLQVARPLALPKGEGATGRLAVTREPVQIPDITAPDAYHGRMRDVLLRMGHRALLAVPLISEDHIVGGLVVNRRQPGEFAPEVIELLRTFATQSALAIQNARLFREVEDKSRQLEVASQHKSEFLANMSHELRTPLNAIIGFSEVLSEKMFGELNEKQEEYSKDIHASGQHLLSLINDILDLSKIEAGRMELELSDFHLPTALDSALTLVRERAGRRSIALHLSVDERLGQIQADERKVRQVVLNLLSNAIKFTPEGGRIDVAAVGKDGLVEVSVGDTGVGIAPEDQEAVFEEFRQVGTADKKVEGTGLGLTLCRKFVELHGGRIWVKSQVGVGSTFTFTIPVRRGE